MAGNEWLLSPLARWRPIPRWAIPNFLPPVSFCSRDSPLFDFIESCLRNKHEMVVYEAASAIVNLPGCSAKELAPAVSGYTPPSPRPHTSVPAGNWALGWGVGGNKERKKENALR